MAVEVTEAEVRDGFSTSASSADIEAYIAIVAQADDCLDVKKVPDPIARQLKVLAVRHLVANATDGGNVTSQRAVSGASRTFQERPDGETQYMSTLRSLDRWGCVIRVVSNGGNVRLYSAGRRAPQ